MTNTTLLKFHVLNEHKCVQITSGSIVDPLEFHSSSLRGRYITHCNHGMQFLNDLQKRINTTGVLLLTVPLCSLAYVYF